MYEKCPKVIDFLLSDELGNEFAKCGFVPTNKKCTDRDTMNKLNWIGWDFLENADLAIVKKNIHAIIDDEQQ
jgi:hypothetical protein